MRKAVFPAVFLLSALYADVLLPAPGAGTTNGMLFIDIAAMDRAILSEITGSWRQVELGADPHAVDRLSPRDRPGSQMLAPIHDVSIDPSVLVLHRSGEIPQVLQSASLRPTIERHFPDLAKGRRRHNSWRQRDQTPDVAPVRLQLSVAGRQLDLAVIEYQVDPPFSLYHLAAIALGTAEDYARFTVSSDDQVAVGTIHIGGSVYRAIPSAGEPSYLIYPIRGGLGREAAYAVSGRTGRIGEVEARHVQMAKIADAQPWSFATSSTGPLVHMTKGEIGALDFQSAVVPTVTAEDKFVVDEAALAHEVEAYLDSIRVLTLLNETVNVDIHRASANGRIHFRQIIHGIAVRDGHRIVVDPATGRVESYGVNLYPSSAAEADSFAWWGEADALSFAIDTIAATFGISGEFNVHGADLSYVRVADNDLDPQWYFEIAMKSNTFIARVNAITGEVTVNPWRH